MPHIGLFCPRCERGLRPNEETCGNCLLDQYSEEVDTALEDRRRTSHTSLTDTNDEYDENEYSRTPRGFTSSEEESDDTEGIMNGHGNGMQNGDSHSREESSRSPGSLNIFEGRSQERRQIRGGTRVGFFVNDDDDRDDEDEFASAGEANGHDHHANSDEEMEEDEENSRRVNGRR